jgi:hypothetical protein
MCPRYSTLSAAKAALLGVDSEATAQEALQHCLHVLQVLLKGVWEDYHIVNKHLGAMGEPCLLKLCVHHALKSSGGVAQPKRHAQPLIQAAAPPERSLAAAVRV